MLHTFARSGRVGRVRTTVGTRLVLCMLQQEYAEENGDPLHGDRSLVRFNPYASIRATEKSATTHGKSANDPR